MAGSQIVKTIEILLVEDNPGDARLTAEALKECGVPSRLYLATDGDEALSFLRRQGRFADMPQPDIILLDLNMPKKGGCEVLAEIKRDNALRGIPVVVLTSSRADEDIIKAYDLHASCYITKPVDFDKFVEVVQKMAAFWLGAVGAPTQK